MRVPTGTWIVMATIMKDRLSRLAARAREEWFVIATVTTLLLLFILFHLAQAG